MKTPDNCLDAFLFRTKKSQANDCSFNIRTARKSLNLSFRVGKANSMTIIKGANITHIALLTKNRMLLEQDSPETFQSENTFLELIQTISEELLKQKEQLLEKLKPEIIECVMNVSKALIFRELKDPEALVHLINSLLDYAASQHTYHHLHVVLAPEDLEMLQGHLSDIKYDIREIEHVRFRAASDMKRGGCRIESELGLLNYAIEREMAYLQATLCQNY